MANLGITFDEFIYCAILAFFVTWFIKNIIKIRSFLNGQTEEGKRKRIAQIIEKCYTLFPTDIVNFKGSIFKRGMIVKITTMQNKTFVGKLVGMNNKNMVCIITNKYVVAHEIYNIDNIEIVTEM